MKKMRPTEAYGLGEWKGMVRSVERKDLNPADLKAMEADGALAFPRGTQASTREDEDVLRATIRGLSQ